VVPALIAGKKTVSNQDLKMSLSIHALFCESTGAGTSEEEA